MSVRTAPQARRRFSFLRPAASANSRSYVPHFEPLEERALMTVTPLQGGDLLVYRMGDGTTTLVPTGNRVFLDEYTPSGTLVESIAMPTTWDGLNNPLIGSGTATSEGGLQLSSDGQYAVTQGYDAMTGGSVSLTGTGAAQGWRVAIDGTVDTTTTVGSFPTGTSDNVRSAASTDGNEFWVSGAPSGVEYVTLGTSSGTAITGPADTTSYQQLQVNNGQLYVSIKKNNAVSTLGSGLPTSGPQTPTELPGLPVGSNTYSYFFAHLNGAGTTPDTLYLTDDTGNGGQITKYSLVGGSWVSNGSMTGAAQVRGLTGSVNNSTGTPTVYLYGSSGLNGTANGGGRNLLGRRHVGLQHRAERHGTHTRLTDGRLERDVPQHFVRAQCHAGAGHQRATIAGRRVGECHQSVRHLGVHVDFAAWGQQDYRSGSIEPRNRDHGRQRDQRRLAVHDRRQHLELLWHTIQLGIVAIGLGCQHARATSCPTRISTER